MHSIVYTTICLAILAGCIVPLGNYMARVYMNECTWLDPVMGGFERLIYKACGIDPKKEMGWRGYAFAILLLGLCGFLLLFIIFVAQGLLPLNPQGFAGLPPALAFNAAVSFVTNTNWQSYGGESTLSYLSQMLGVTVQNFLSAATGMAVGVALTRGLIRKQAQTIGNAYADVIRGILYILLPLSLALSFVLASQGVITNLSPYTAYTPLNGQGEALIAQGPVASQLAIKMLGSNGGGFFNANGAHPFENPTPLTNIVQIVCMMLIPASFIYMFGAMVGDRRQGIVLLAAITAIFIPLMLLAEVSEQQPNPFLPADVIDTSAGNMEGKEMRFGIVGSALWATATTATSNGSVNSMHDSYQPLGGLAPLMLIQFEVLFGGVGSGLYGMLMFVLLTVFMGGLMVGRTPEYLGKKLGPFEIKMASLVMVLPGALMLAGTAIAVATEAGRQAVLNPGPHAFTEVLYAFASASNNNGSAFAGVSTNTPFYHIALSICMFLGRYWLIVPVLAIAGAMAARNAMAPSAGTLPTNTPLFTTMLCFVILLNLLTYLPSLALGPIAEHLKTAQMVEGRAP
jgi:potassium-transporting ATPase potassium-binding subunit